MKTIQQTVFHDRHEQLGAKLVEFGGWDMPLMYPDGIVKEHLSTRKGSGLFDVSHMGRFLFRGIGAVGFLQHVLSNNVQALDKKEMGAQYTIIPTETGGAVDDAYLYAFVEGEYLLVVNAANREKDWEHFQTILSDFKNVDMTDITEEVAMLSLQGPESRHILEEIVDSGSLPEPKRNTVSTGSISGYAVQVARTGYTGEPLCFELFVDRENALALWDTLVEKGATPIGLGARDTLRLEAGLPLYGHEMGIDPEGNEIPLFACPVAKPAVSFSTLKGDFRGRTALLKQFEAYKKMVSRDYSLLSDLPRMIRTIAIAGRGIARAGSKIYYKNKLVGFVTSGTMIPMWIFEGEGLISTPSDKHTLRSICLALIDSDLLEGDTVAIEIRNKEVPGVITPFHLRSEAPPWARPILYDHEGPSQALPSEEIPNAIQLLLRKAAENTIWRQRECINLIPSEMTLSPMTKVLSVMDPAFRYAEHKKSKAFYDEGIFYYQGTDFIAQVEALLAQQMKQYLGCEQVETRLISGQMANMAVFSAMMDYLNRADRKREPRRIRRVLCNHIGKGGHLSAQPMGALKDFIAHDPKTERPAVVNFPVLRDNPYKMDVPATLDIIDQYRPELIIFGKSMVLHKEPVADIRKFLDAAGIKSVIMYDMAHVLGLIGPHFQEPFKEGADLVTGSTHKTYFGTQRGIVGGRYDEQDASYELWEALERRAFPGSVSNHHLGTMLGLLGATYEMNHFKDEYQQKVLANAKTLAKGLRHCGMDVAGDPAIDFTETHQVILNVGYSRGPEIAEELEANNIICNYQAEPSDEGFTASGALRLGTSEMTRFGMEKEDFEEVAQLIADVVKDRKSVQEEVLAMRRKFQEIQFCFKGEEYDELLNVLHGLI